MGVATATPTMCIVGSCIQATAQLDVETRLCAAVMTACFPFPPLGTPFARHLGQCAAHLYG